MQFKFVFCLLIFSSLCACVKQETGAFKREYLMALDIPAGASPLASHQFDKIITSSWIQFLQENHLQQKDIKAVKPKSIVLTPVFDNTISYEIISEGHVFIYPYNNVSEILPIADVYDPQGDRNELIFLPGLADVKDIVSQPEFVLRLKLNLKASTATLSEHHLTVQFDIFLN